VSEIDTNPSSAPGARGSLRRWLSRRRFLGAVVATGTAAGTALAALLARRSGSHPQKSPSAGSNPTPRGAPPPTATSPRDYQLHPLPQDPRLREKLADLDHEDSAHLAG
jgi:hypothetical protein